MSTESTREQPTVRCNGPGCDTHGKRWEFRDGEYCGTECETRADGDEILRSIRLDHRRCFSCFRPLKEVTPPKPDFEFTERGHGWTIDDEGNPTLVYYSQEVTREAATGFQTLTPHAGKGEKQHGDSVVTGTICDECGNTDHRHNEPTFSTRAAIGRLVALIQADDDVEDIHPGVVHREYEQTGDVDLAVGRALE